MLMTHLRSFVVVGIAAALCCTTNTAAIAQAANDGLDIDQSILAASAISVEFALPIERPTLNWLIRHKMKYNRDDLVGKYLKGDVTSTKIYSNIYGEGTGYLLTKKGETEAHLKVFDYGFEYQLAAKNINKGIAKFVPMGGKSEKGMTMLDQGYTDFDYAGEVKGKWMVVYTPDEGKTAALKLLKDYIGEIPDQGKDFTVEYQGSLEKIEDGLFILNVNKYFRGVPLLDDYIQLSLDADKKLVGVSYFWDDRLAPGPPPPGDKQIVDAAFAINQAKLWVIQQSGGQAPHLTLMKIKLGYITMRNDYVTLMPVWLLACAWQHKVGADMDVEAPGLRKQKPQMKRFVEWLEKYDIYIAIEAISGLPTEL